MSRAGRNHRSRHRLIQAIGRANTLRVSPASGEAEMTFATPFSPKGDREREDVEAPRSGPAEQPRIRKLNDFDSWGKLSALTVCDGGGFLPTYLPTHPPLLPPPRADGPRTPSGESPPHPRRSPTQAGTHESANVSSQEPFAFPWRHACVSSPVPSPFPRVAASFRRARASDQAPRGNRFWSSLRVPGIRHTTDRAIDVDRSRVMRREREKERDGEAKGDTTRVAVQDPDYRGLVMRRFQRNNVCRGGGKNDASWDRSDFASAGKQDFFPFPFFFFFFLRRQYGRDGIKIVITTEVYDSAGLKTTLGLCDGRERYMSLCRMFLDYSLAMVNSSNSSEKYMNLLK